MDIPLESYIYRFICTNCGKSGEKVEDKGTTRPIKTKCSECGCYADTYPKERIVIA